MQTFLVAVAAVLLVFWLVCRRGRLLRASTGRVIKEFGYWRFLSLRGLHFYVYARWPRHYIAFVVRHVLGRPDEARR